MKIGHPKDFWGGVVFAALGLAFAAIARGIPWIDFTVGTLHVALPGYSMGTPARMGPAFFPFWLGTMLLVLGLWIAIRAIRTHGGEAGRLEKWHFKPLLLVLASIVAFGLLLKIIGMLLSGIVLVVGASFGSHDFRWKATLVLAVFLVIFSALVFVVGLKLPIPLCPDVESLQPYAVCRA